MFSGQHQQGLQSHLYGRRLLLGGPERFFNELNKYGFEFLQQ